MKRQYLEHDDEYQVDWDNAYYKEEEAYYEDEWDDDAIPSALEQSSGRH